MLVSQACLAKLGMKKRVRHGSITLDDYDAPSLEVVRQVGTGLFIIRIDLLIYNDYVRNPLLDDLVIDVDDEPGDFWEKTCAGNSSECSKQKRDVSG